MASDRDNYTYKYNNGDYKLGLYRPIYSSGNCYKYYNEESKKYGNEDYYYPVLKIILII